METPIKKGKGRPRKYKPKELLECEEVNGETICEPVDIEDVIDEACSAIAEESDKSECSCAKNDHTIAGIPGLTKEELKKALDEQTEYVKQMLNSLVSVIKTPTPTPIQTQPLTNPQIYTPTEPSIQRPVSRWF